MDGNGQSELIEASNILNAHYSGLSIEEMRVRLKSEVDQLRGDIAALDRRVPRLERSGEADIARDAAALREQAVARIAALERSR